MNKISVIIPAYNAEEVLERAVRSVMAQTYPHWEAIIVDDGSTDSTPELTRRLAEEIGERAKAVIPGVNGGLSAARNQGLDVATGDWITYLDADDEFTPERLQVMVDAIEPEVDVVVCRHILIPVSGEERVRGHRAATVSGEAALQELLLDEMPPYVWDKMFRTEAVGALRFSGIARAEDKIYDVQALRLVRQVRYLDEALYRYYVFPTSLTWAKVTTVEQTEQLMAALREAVGDDAAMQPALAVTEVAAYLNVAHQAMSAMDRQHALAHAKACARHIDRTALSQTFPRKPAYGVAATLLRTAPGAYTRLYQAYTKRRYGLGAQ